MALTMADLSSLLTVLEHDPDDIQALEALVGAARTTPPDLRATRFANARKMLGSRGRPDAVVLLIDAELATTGDVDRKVDLLLEKGMVLDGDLLDVPGARAAFVEVTKLRADDSMAKEALGELELAQSNWKKFADKYIAEATASTDRSLATGLYVSAAEAYVLAYQHSFDVPTNFFLIATIGGSVSLVVANAFHWLFERRYLSRREASVATA